MNDNLRLAKRLSTVKRSFIREILKVTERPEVISFAGGLPNPAYFPQNELADAAKEIISQNGSATLQYATTAGLPSLRKWIADRYAQQGVIGITPDQIIITHGSQQALDLIGKVFLDKGDEIIIEEPGYLGALQALSLYQPEFLPVPLNDQGPDLDMLGHWLQTRSPKLFYTVPNFQNPSGLTYPAAVRHQIGAIMAAHNIYLIEDNPYGDLRYSGTAEPSFLSVMPEQTITMGSFSKIIAPGLRLGWIVSPPELFQHFITVKQAADLHSNIMAQHMLDYFVRNHDVDAHIAKVQAGYRQQRDAMLDLLAEWMPPDISYTQPDGGMFVWVTLPPGVSAMQLFDLAAARDVAFVPGNPFYLEGRTPERESLRLSFSNVSPDEIEEGMRRFSQALNSLLVAAA